MKILLTTLNSKFIHSSLALRCLRSYCNDEFNISLAEYTINQHSDDVVAEIYKEQPDIVGFSCYIWNIDQTLEIVKLLKKVRPELTIILGGPEVSYDPVNLLNDYSEIDYIIYGEGEITLKKLLEQLERNKKLENIKGLAYRLQGEAKKTEPRSVLINLDEIPSPYQTLDGLENKIVYYETMRGCPFNCQYCLSSTLSSVRFFSLDRVKNDLLKLIEAEVRQVKFVDRTFNCKAEHCLEIFKFLLANRPKNCNINFHFEITADLLTDQIIEFLAEVPPGYFQFEIGVQSTNSETLNLIDRTMDFEQLSQVVTRLSEARNIHLHLDLIAGLPAEDYDTFKSSFNDVYQLASDRLQLGFLKLLKGSGLRKKADQYGYAFTDKPPYEVLVSNDLSYNDLLKLKMVEEVLETFGNSHHFDYSIKFIENNFYDSPFEFYEDLAQFWEENKYYRYSHKLESLYQYLKDFYQQYCQEKIELFNELLKFDFLLRRRRINLPDFLNKYEVKDYKNKFNDFVANETKIEKYLPQLSDCSKRQIKRQIQVETFKYDILKVIKNPSQEVEEDLIIILFNYHTRERLFNKAIFKQIEL
jgi:radical SAM superfamily enzyme YgiQ (UPF0313 family)